MKLTGKHKLLDWKLNFTRERWRVDTLGRESNDKVKFFSFSEKMYIHVRNSAILSCGRVKIHIPNMFLFVTGSKYRSSRTLINFLPTHYRVHKPPFTENSLQYQFTVNIIMAINGPKWTWQPQKGYVMVIVVLGIWRNEKVFWSCGTN